MPVKLWSRWRGDSHLLFGVLMMTSSAAELAVTSLVRIATSYSAIELGLSAVWIGILSAAFNVLPVLLAVSVGRLIDRGYDALMAWFGGVLLVIACLGFALTKSLLMLLVFTSVLGIAHLLFSIAVQVLCSRRGSPQVMERMVGNYMIATAIGQGIGPFIVGWIGGSASIPPTYLLYWAGVGLAMLCLVTVLMLRSGEPRPVRIEGSKPARLRDIFRTPGVSVAFFNSVVTVVAQDLIVVYMPLLGTERNMSSDQVGNLLAVRAIAAVASRICFTRLSAMLGSWRLMALSTLVGAAAYVGLAAPLPLSLMYVVIAIAGGALGISVTVGIASVLSLVASDVRGVANSLRTGGTRLGQVVVPFLAGMLATAAGAASIFIVIGASLAAAGTVIRFRSRKV